MPGIRARRALGEANVYVNFGSTPRLGMLRRENVMGMAEEGAIGYKILMMQRRLIATTSFWAWCIPNEGEFYEALRLVKETYVVLFTPRTIISWNTTSLD